MDLRYLRELASDTAYFGYLLAGKVADKLDEGHSIGYSHRDYCGMGLEKNNRGEYQYGELYDGAMMIPSKFASRETFVEWLAFQSTASLARLNDKDEFYRGNQTITRQRLEQFLGQSFGKF